MNQRQVMDTKLSLLTLSVYYQKPLDDTTLVMYCEDLADYDFDQVQLAMRKYRQNPKNKFMPLPAQLIEMFSPQISEDQAAREITGRIVEAVSRFGYARGEDAKEYIGEIGWSVIQVYGGWIGLCEGLGIYFSNDSFNAQCRELVKARVIHGDKIGEHVKALEYKRGEEPLRIEHEGKNNVLEIVKSLANDAKVI